MEKWSCPRFLVFLDLSISFCGGKLLATFALLAPSWIFPPPWRHYNHGRQIMLVLQEANPLLGNLGCFMYKHASKMDLLFV